MGVPLGYSIAAWIRRVNRSMDPARFQTRPSPPPARMQPSPPAGRRKVELTHPMEPPASTPGPAPPPRQRQSRWEQPDTERAPSPLGAPLGSPPMALAAGSGGRGGEAVARSAERTPPPPAMPTPGLRPGYAPAGPAAGAPAGTTSAQQQGLPSPGRAAPPPGPPLQPAEAGVVSLGGPSAGQTPTRPERSGEPSGGSSGRLERDYSPEEDRRRMVHLASRWERAMPGVLCWVPL